MAIVEEIIIQGDSSGAEAAWKRASGASEQATTKMTSHAQRVQEAWQRIEARRAKDALAEVQRMSQADELQKKLQKKFSETAAGMAAVGLAIAELGRAADVALKMMAERLAPKNELGMALDATQHKFLAIKQVIEDTNLNKVEKMFALAFSAGDSDFSAAMARMDALDAGVRERERDRAAADALAQQDAERTTGASVNLMASSGVGKKLANIDRDRREARIKAREKRADDQRLNGRDMDDAVADFYKQQEERKKIAEKMSEDIAAKQQEIYDSNLERQIKASNDIIEEEERLAERRKEIWQDLADVGMGLATEMTSTAVDALFAQADGQKPALDAIADSFLEANGKMLVSRGIMDVLIGTARGFAGDPTGPALAAVGGIEIGAGAAMMGGALIIPGKGNQGGGGGGSSGGGGGSRDFVGGGGRGSSRGSEGDNSPIIINVNGVLTSKEAGREIEEAILKSKRRYRA